MSIPSAFWFSSGASSGPLPPSNPLTLTDHGLATLLPINSGSAHYFEATVNVGVATADRYLVIVPGSGIEAYTGATLTLVNVTCNGVAMTDLAPVFAPNRFFGIALPTGTTAIIRFNMSASASSNITAQSVFFQGIFTVKGQSSNTPNGIFYKSQGGPSAIAVPPYTATTLSPAIGSVVAVVILTFSQHSALGPQYIAPLSLSGSSVTNGAVKTSIGPTYSYYSWNTSRSASIPALAAAGFPSLSQSLFTDPNATLGFGIRIFCISFK
jgi:hypothetical protein